MLKNYRYMHQNLVVWSLLISFVFFNLSIIEPVFNNATIKGVCVALKFFFLIIAVFLNYMNGASKNLLILSLAFLTVGLIAIDKVLLETSLALLLVSVFFNRKKAASDVYQGFYKILLLLFICVVIVIGFSYIGIIPQKIYENPNPQSSAVLIIIESKNSLGYWNPNVVSSLICSVVLVSFMLSSSKLYFFSTMLYLFTLPILLSKTYVLIMFACLSLTFLYNIKAYFIVKMGAVISILVTLLIFLISYALVFLPLFREQIPDHIYNVVNVFTSLRLMIIEDVLKGVPVLDIVTGLRLTKEYLDSGVINFIFCFGVGGSFLLFSLYLWGMQKNLMKGNYKAVYFLMFFVVINFFESLIYFNSLLFVFTLYLLNCAVGKNSLNYIQTLTESTGKRA